MQITKPWKTLNHSHKSENTHTVFPDPGPWQFRSFKKYIALKMRMHYLKNNEIANFFWNVVPYLHVLCLHGAVCLSLTTFTSSNRCDCFFYTSKMPRSSWNAILPWQINEAPCKKYTKESCCSFFSFVFHCKEIAPHKIHFRPVFIHSHPLTDKLNCLHVRCAMTHISQINFYS